MNLRFSFVIFCLGFLVVSCGNKDARTLHSGKHDLEINRCLELSNKKKYKSAVDCLEVYKSRFANNQDAQEADLLIGDNYFNRKEYLVAAEVYQDFIRQYPYHSKVDYAYYKSGLAYLEKSPKSIDRSDEYTDLAEQNFKKLIQFFPNSVYADPAKEYHQQVRQKLASKEFYVAKFYFKNKEYLASIPRFSVILREYPGTGFDQRSFYHLITAYAKTNQEDQAIKIYEVFEKNFPGSQWVVKSRSSIKSF